MQLLSLCVGGIQEAEQKVLVLQAKGNTCMQQEDHVRYACAALQVHVYVWRQKAAQTFHALQPLFRGSNPSQAILLYRPIVSELLGIVGLFRGLCCT